MARQARLHRELAKMKASECPGIYVYPKSDDLTTLEAKIMGPSDSPYENGVFRLEILVPEKYPFTPPSIRFLTKVYHPNIDRNGRICLDLIKMPPAGAWKPTIGLEGLLIAIRMLLESPNPDDPLVADIALEYKNFKSDFEKKARELTQWCAK